MNDRDMPLKQLLLQFPFLTVYLNDLSLPLSDDMTFHENMEKTDDSFFEQRRTSRQEEEEAFENYVRNAAAVLNAENCEKISKLEIQAGNDKDGNPETFGTITAYPSMTIAIVGETGSGKSRLLEDIEWQADHDTPTGRNVLINGKRKTSFSRGDHFVAQLSQNMNFVLDMNVHDFLLMHAMCYAGQEEAEKQVLLVYDTAMRLCGEKFKEDTSITSLSGGQSRALMIADCAVISRAPVVLIDEIENAGIDRQLALAVLAGNDKIVFIATHDPVLALLADERVMIRNGGIQKILKKDEEEEKVLQQAQRLDRIMLGLRRKIRSGEKLTMRDYCSLEEAK